jgi:F-type H+-transporting ATPase subunit c
MRNVRYLLVPLTLLGALLVPEIAFAAGDTAAASSAGQIGMAAGIAIGVAAMGCGIGQGLVAFAALQGIARNPSAAGKIQTPMIIGLALIESLCIYALVIAFFLQGKV